MRLIAITGGSLFHAIIECDQCRFHRIIFDQDNTNAALQPKALGPRGTGIKEQHLTEPFALRAVRVAKNADVRLVRSRNALPSSLVSLPPSYRI